MLHKKWLAVILAVTALSVTPAFADDDDDDDDYRPRKTQTHQTQKAQRSSQRAGLISAQKAGENARAKLPNSRVRSVEYDNDDRHGAVYEVELIKGGQKYDAKVNAKTGKVIYIKRDN